VLFIYYISNPYYMERGAGNLLVGDVIQGIFPQDIITIKLLAKMT